MQRYQIASSTNTIVKVGRKHNLGTGCVSILLNYLCENNRITLYMAATNFKTASGTKLSVRSIRYCLRKNGIRSFVAVSELHLTNEHVEARLLWSVERYHWTVLQ